MATLRAWTPVCSWAILCAILGPVWVTGFALAWVHRVANLVVVNVIRWGFWEPTQAVWVRLVGAYRQASAKAAPQVADEVERKRKAKDFARRARRVGRGGI